MEDTTKKDVKHASAGKENKGMPKNRGQDNIRDDMKEYSMSKDMVHNRSVWRMKTTTGPLLHGGGLSVTTSEQEHDVVVFVKHKK